MLGLRLVGQLLAFAINAIIGNIWGEQPGVWRYMLAVAAIPAVGLFVGMLQMPQSPRWLISKNRHDEALEVLMQVRTEERARVEMVGGGVRGWRLPLIAPRLLSSDRASMTGVWFDSRPENDTPVPNSGTVCHPRRLTLCLNKVRLAYATRSY